MGNRSSTANSTTTDTAATQKEWRTKIRPPTRVLTGRQMLYLLVFQAIGPAIVAGAINFGIQTAVYDNSKSINLFAFPNTIAGDMAVTLIVQLIITWFLSGFLVWMDLHSGRLVAPIVPEALGGLCACKRLGPGPVGTAGTTATTTGSATTVPPTAGAATSVGRGRRNPCGRLGEFMTTREDIWNRFPPKLTTGADGVVTSAPAASRATLVWWNLVRSIAWFPPMFAIFWSLGVGISAAIWGEHNYNHFPQTPLILTVYGAAIGFFFTPIVALSVMTTAGRWMEYAAATNTAVLPPHTRWEPAVAGGGGSAAGAGGFSPEQGTAAPLLAPQPGAPMMTRQPAATVV